MRFSNALWCHRRSCGWTRMESNKQHEIVNTVGYIVDRPPHSTWPFDKAAALPKGQPLSWNSCSFEEKLAGVELDGYVQASSYALWLFPQNMAAAGAIQRVQKRIQRGRKDLYRQAWSRLPRKRNISHSKGIIGWKWAALCGPVVYFKALTNWGFEIRFPSLRASLRHQPDEIIRLRIRIGKICDWAVHCAQ